MAEVSVNSQEPVSVIHDKQTLQIFLNSDICKEIEGFVQSLSNSVKGKPNSTSCHVSKVTESILQVLDTLQQYIVEVPPLPTRSRFGNKAFCDYFDKLQQNLVPLHKVVLPEHLWDATTEIGPYLLHSVGNRQRIDYGSGHELNFVMWLFCLQRLGLVGAEDHTALVLRVFQKYLVLMRNLQKSYFLEPAGSHGVWGLDDYQFLPFLFGSSQLIDHKNIRPKSICYKEIVESYASEYMYLGCIQFINQVKTAGSFFEHSPLLFDISGAKSWEKVNQGMIKMFHAEVLSKLPIMSHFMFGSLIPFNVDPSQLNEHKDDDCCDHNKHHDHAQDSADQPKYRVVSCCVQRIPSSIAARSLQEEKELPA